MPLLLRILLACFVVGMTPKALGLESDPCGIAQSTVDRRACRHQQMKELEQRLQLYWKTAQQKATAKGLDPLQFNAAQSSWERYRSEHCGNVYMLWKDASIRYEMVAVCNQKLIKDRTYDLWKAYLSSIDGTPPVLPDPNLYPMTPPYRCHFNQAQAIEVLRLDDATSIKLIWSDGVQQSYKWVGNPPSLHHLTDWLGGRWDFKDLADQSNVRRFALKNIDNGNLIECD